MHDPIQHKKFNFENLWVDLTYRKSALSNFELLQLSAIPDMNPLRTSIDKKPHQTLGEIYYKVTGNEQLIL